MEKETTENRFMKNNEWAIKVTSSIMLVYTYAVTVPIILDHKITDIMHKHNRNYKLWPVAVLIGIVLLISVFMTVKKNKWEFYPVFMLISAAAAENIIVMPQQLPHLFLLLVTSVGSTLCLAHIWIRTSYNEAKRDLYKSPTLAYTKEKIFLFRSIMFGLIGVYLYAFGGLVKSMDSTALSTIGPLSSKTEDSYYILKNLNISTLGFFGFHGFIFAVYESASSWKKISKYLLEIKSDSGQ